MRSYPFALASLALPALLAAQSRPMTVSISAHTVTMCILAVRPRSAARFLADKNSGLFDMNDVLGLT